jgi:nucleotide-binding universal stress UspA family protein
MLKVIAVGTDGSATADKAVDAAMDLAERFDAELVVLSAYDGKPSGLASAALAAAWMPPSPVEIQWTAQAAGRVEEILARATHRAEARGLACRSAASEGDAAEVLVELADSHGADILVIGNKGMQRRMLGSVPNSVTHKARCSVLVVKTS